MNAATGSIGDSSTGGIGVDAADGMAAACPEGESVCMGLCVNVMTDSNNCGYCGLQCPAGQACQSGACCAVGWTWCAGSAECVNEVTDPTNCGGCGTQCQPSAPTCQSGGCVCLTGTVCGGICVNELADATHCGGCATACPPSAPTCEAGTCTCPSGTLCSGACVDETTNANDCGGCGAQCPAATPFCYQGSCTATPPSCAPGGPGMTNCGTPEESCCASLEVTGGTFYRTYDYASFDYDAGVYAAQLAPDGGPSGQADPATVSTFLLDKYPVTVGRFRQFVSAWNGGAGWFPPAGSGKHAHLNGGLGLADIGAPGSFEPGWDPAGDTYIALTDGTLTSCMWPYTWTSAAGANENLPMDCVDWFEGYAFCIWDGGFLPSEAEWEYAAAGGDEQREYPWGSADPGTANQYAIYGCYYPSGSRSCTGIANIAPVGTPMLGAGRWGQLDLVGSVGAWDVDGFTPYENPCVDCGLFTPWPQSYYFSQGGWFSDATRAYLASPAGTTLNFPQYRGYGLGFRCARSPH
jgi:sulfatase modifying factor 1